MANITGIGWVNEIDVRVTSVGGNRNHNGADAIPSTTGINNIEGRWTFPGGAAYMPEVEVAAPELALTTNGAADSASVPPYEGGAATPRIARSTSTGLARGPA